MAVGLFSLYAASGDERWFETAIDLVRGLDRFARPDGGFYSTASGTAELVKRPTDVTDNPLPSGNAMAAEALMLASLYTGNEMWREMAEAAMESVAVLMDRHPSMVGHHLSVLHSSRRTKELAIVGPEWRNLARIHWARFRPNVALAVSAGGITAVPLLDGRTATEGAKAFVCQGFICDLPTDDPVELAAELGERPRWT
jgi:hypothetical protein